jgi:hypothetical protein
MITDTAIVCPDVARGAAGYATSPHRPPPGPRPLTPFFRLPGTIRIRTLAYNGHERTGIGQGSEGMEPRASWRVHDPHRSHPARRRRLAEWGGGKDEDGTKGPIPRSRDPESCRTGVPPHRFVVRQRIASARSILARPDVSIAEISRLIGFRTPSHFTMVFRRAVGVTPGAYRTAASHEARLGRGGG